MSDTGLLDTSAVIALPRLPSVAGLRVHPVTTAITFAELALGPLLAQDDRRASAAAGRPSAG